ncbi:hypothetical protein CAI18_22325 [Xanthomonas citri pv. punicae]|nr:hypothetical protein CAI14_21775 [Xanthomonas citri pv. punicae]QCZ70425.1 hypothetical protein CAI17_19410 [Xanthomonas citri pv. punicae]QCZ78776.1 hypothetical protein XapA_20345 [Xanthomonas citri pv. punicae]QCZ79797.1 hypothetical protein XapB_00860 [Xanthomonas citri pv. punicae]QCZ87326.1 hypothetical protein CAI18_22325 [Xanthomonas citri pv. punicae]
MLQDAAGAPRPLYICDTQRIRQGARPRSNAHGPACGRSALHSLRPGRRVDSGSAKHAALQVHRRLAHIERADRHAARVAHDAQQTAHIRCAACCLARNTCALSPVLRSGPARTGTPAQAWARSFRIPSLP